MTTLVNQPNLRTHSRTKIKSLLQVSLPIYRFKLTINYYKVI